MFRVSARTMRVTRMTRGSKRWIDVAARSMSSTGKSEQLFDAETAAVYSKIANQHFHEDGPWPIMKDKVVQMAAGGKALSIMDLATGPGQPGISIAEALPGSKIVLSDINEDMIEKSRKASEHLSNVDCCLADMIDLSAFPDESFDIVVCCYGFMFPEDKARSLSETHRILKKGGAMIATTWDNVDMLPLMKDIMTDVLGFVPPPPPLNPMSLAEPGLFEGLVEDAGFSNITVSRSKYPFDLGDDPEFQYKVATLLVKDKITELDAHDKAKKAFTTHKDKYGTLTADGTLLLTENTFKLTIATKS